MADVHVETVVDLALHDGEEFTMVDPLDACWTVNRLKWVVGSTLVRCYAAKTTPDRPDVDWTTNLSRIPDRWMTALIKAGMRA